MKAVFSRFFALESASAFVLAACTVTALLLANSGASAGYFSLLETRLFGLSLLHWINDGLMAIFFFVVGMEIKRELVIGELASPKKAALPIAAAIGGMVAPALVYLFFNRSVPASQGWGIPMATDIAFAVAVLGFFRVPPALKVFLLALAIVDDLGAVLVIALFYTSSISGPWLAGAAMALLLMILLRKAGVRRYLPFIALGVFTWFCVLKSGVHATVAGVIIGLLTPLRLSGEEEFTPLDDLIHRLHPWVSFGIMPVFALANAGVALGAGGVDWGNPVFLGIALGLFLGKPVGILLACRLSVWAGLAQLPGGVRWGQLLAVGLLGGVGFTMALFISSLALPPELEIYSKTGILAGSSASALVGALLLLALKSRKH